MQPQTELRLIGILHDIGKLQISQEILNKPSSLTDDEFSEIKKHPKYGENILRELPGFTSKYQNVILYHHENIDGTGYYHIQESNIPYLSKMIRIIDSYDAMIYGRIYQNRKTVEVAQKELLSLRGKFYDQNLVDQYIFYLQKKMWN